MGKLNQTASLRSNKKYSDFEINLNDLNGLVDPPHQVYRILNTLMTDLVCFMFFSFPLNSPYCDIHGLIKTLKPTKNIC